MEEFNTQDVNLAGKISANLQPYKQIVPTLYSVFTWQKQYYPIVLGAGVTSIFFLIWILDASFLTTISLAGFFIAVTEYLLPFCISSLFDSDKWSEENEETYQKVCNNLAYYWEAYTVRCAHYSQLRQSKSKSYYLSVLAALLGLAWVGNVFNNLFLAYIVTLKLVLLPGLKHHGIIKQAWEAGLKTIKGVISKEKKN